uniref:Uncharacterized protein n=1 Tax=Tanacetum cinerariifolium TaxID=118510 RepID=A0A6L2M797_TANCI|nr:hypothetical protein [Tanacetum cinerariifolium]
MIPEPGDVDRAVPVPEMFHEQTDDKLAEAKIKQMEVDDQAIQTILLDLPKDIYAVVDSCKTAQEIWLRVQQMMKGSDIGIQEKKAKLFSESERRSKLNYSTPTNNNQGISSNPRNRQIAQPGMNMGQDRQRQMQMVGGCSECSLESKRSESRAKGNAIRNNGNQIRCYNYKGLGHLARNCIAKEFDLMAAAVDLDKIEEINANCILMANLQQASTWYTELLEPILEPHQVQQNDSNVISMVSSIKQGRGTVEQHYAFVEETRTFHESLSHNLLLKLRKSILSIAK